MLGGAKVTRQGVFKGVVHNFAVSTFCEQALIVNKARRSQLKALVFLIEKDAKPGDMLHLSVMHAGEVVKLIPAVPIAPARSEIHERNP